MSTKERYREYLESPEWEKLRLAAYSRAEGKCEFCGSKGAAVHHIRYPKNLKEDDCLDNLVVVCDKCHDRIHGILGDEAGATVDVSATIEGFKKVRRKSERIIKSLSTRWDYLDVKISRLDVMIKDLQGSDYLETLNRLKYEKFLLEEEQEHILEALNGW